MQTKEKFYKNTGQKKTKTSSSVVKISIDGIRRISRPKLRPVQKISSSHIHIIMPGQPVRRKITFNRSLAVALMSVVLAFSGGMWYEWSTPKSAAEDFSQTARHISYAENSLQVLSDQEVQNQAGDELFKTPLMELKDYMQIKARNEVLDVRKAKLHEFLKQWDSPLEAQADLIAEQDHWKLILSIAFAESTLGKNCVGNNCSGIGGSKIRDYRTLGNWILGFNRLIERKYKDKTLEQMCGVYVQPCNPRWLMANKQILTALDKAEIE